MRHIFSVLLLTFVLAPAALARAPQAAQVMAKSAAITSAAVEAVETLDTTRVYRLRLELGGGRPAAGNIEYEIFTEEGTVIGGGMFTVRPEMFDGNTLSVLSGFGGIELSPGSSISVWFDSTAPGLAAEGKRGGKSAAEPQIVDTCTTYCDRCADKTAVCTHGVHTYSCSCSDSNRSCTFSCFGRPQM